MRGSERKLLRTWMVWLLLVCAGGVASAAAQQEPAPPLRPNVLFIAVDDLNDWVGFLGGYPGMRTPNLDRLARRGVIFTQAYCAAPACNPSRTALLTGRHPTATGVYQNNQPWRPVLADAVTLPQQFRRHGYRVAGAGKIFHFNDPESWDEYLPRPADPAPALRPANGLAATGDFDWGPLEADDAAMGDARVVQWAADYLARPRQRPFFLGVGLYRPHLPWYVPRAYFDRHPLEGIRRPSVLPDDLADVPPAGRRMAGPQGDHRRVTEAGQWDKAIQGYLASISFTDAMIGRLIDALDRSESSRNTVIVLWGDHGWHLGEKEHWRKFALWERATRTPLVVIAPGVARAGARSPRPVSLMDLYPTLNELCNMGGVPNLQGESLVPLLRDPSGPRKRPVLTSHGRGNHAVRTERWRYIRYRDGGEELYDHLIDPHEWNNLASRPESAPVKAELAQHIPASEAPDAPTARGSGE